MTKDEVDQFCTRLDKTFKKFIRRNSSPKSSVQEDRNMEQTEAETVETIREGCEEVPADSSAAAPSSEEQSQEPEPA